MIHIQILGAGCPNCDRLYQNAQDALAESGIEAQVERVTDPDQIREFGVMITPALAINGAVKFVGNVPSARDIIQTIHYFIESQT